MTATLFKHLNEQGYKFFYDNNRDFKSRTLFVGGERCPVALFESFVERRPFHAMVFFFYLSSKRNRKFKHLVKKKSTGENTITNIMKVSVAGTSLKESEKTVYESLCKTSEQLWLHSPIDGSVGRKQIASFIFGF